MIISIREWLSINLIALGLRMCPFPEMEELLRRGLNLGIESYFNRNNKDESQ